MPCGSGLGGRIADDSFLLLFNASAEPAEFVLPEDAYGQMWEVVLDTADPLHATRAGSDGVVKAATTVPTADRSVVVLRRRY